MTKGKMILAGLGLLSAVSVASAADVDLYFISGCGDNPAVASNATKYIGDAAQDATLSGIGAFNGAVNYHTGSLDVYMKVAAKSAGCGSETISSLGLDVNFVRTAGLSTLAADSFTVHIDASTTGSSQDPWSSPSPNTPTLNVTGKLVEDSRAVAVPTTHVDNLWNGYCPNGGVYKAASLAMHTGGAGLGVGNPTTTWELRMAVGNLKITRVVDPMAVPPGTVNETVRFGTGDVSVDNGSVVGVQNNLIADATVIARKKGDFGSFDGNGIFSPVPDGVVGAGELAQFLAAVGQNCGTDTIQTWAGDFGSFDGNGIFSATPDGVVGAGELAQFLAAVGS